MKYITLCLVVLVGLACGLEQNQNVQLPPIPILQLTPVNVQSLVDLFNNLLQNVQQLIISHFKPGVKTVDTVLLKGIQDNLSQLYASLQSLGSAAFNNILSQILAHESTQQIISTLSSFGIGFGKRGAIQSNLNDLLQQFQQLGSSTVNNILSHLLAHESTQQIISTLSSLGISLGKKRNVVNLVQEVVQLILPYVPEWLRKIIETIISLFKVLA
jgi:hypothetical protein